MSQSTKNVYELRRMHNADLIRRMRNGEPLNAFDSKASWFPPRPIIKKDSREMARLYRASTTDAKAKEKANHEPEAPSDLNEAG